MNKNQNTKDDMCMVYASDYHFEMISLPYIDKSLEQNREVIILTENDLDKTIEVLVSKINLKDEIRKLEPFGEGNEEPVFLLRNVYVCDAMKMGKNGEHLRLTVWGRDKKELKLVAFNAEKEWLKVDFGFRVNVWVKLVENVWKGSRKVEGRILKMTLEDDEVF